MSDTVYYVRYKPEPSAPWKIVRLDPAKFDHDVFNLVEHCRERMFGPLTQEQIDADNKRWRDFNVKQAEARRRALQRDARSDER